MVAGRGTIFTFSDRALFAIEEETGAERWRFPFPRTTPGALLSVLRLCGDRIVLGTNQVGDPLICLEARTGRRLWAYPADPGGQMAFYEMAPREGLLLVRAGVRVEGGYRYENRAIDLADGAPAEWPRDLIGVPEPAVAPPEVAVSFAGEGEVARRDGDRFAGILEREGARFALRRPRFFLDEPLYRVEAADRAVLEDLERLARRRVEIRGDCPPPAESAPPQFTVLARSVREAGR